MTKEKELKEREGIKRTKDFLIEVLEVAFSKIYGTTFPSTFVTLREGIERNAHKIYKMSIGAEDHCSFPAVIVTENVNIVREYATFKYQGGCYNPGDESESGRRRWWYRYDFGVPLYGKIKFGREYLYSPEYYHRKKDEDGFEDPQEERTDPQIDFSQELLAFWVESSGGTYLSDSNGYTMEEDPGWSQATVVIYIPSQL